MILKIIKKAKMWLNESILGMAQASLLANFCT